MIEREGAKCRQSGAPFDVEYTVRLAAGSERIIWTHGSLTQTPDGLLHWVGVNLDVTEREKIKEQLRRQIEALLEADHRKDRFLATLAHELRSPLAPIRNALELLRLADKDATQIEQARGLFERQMQRIVRMPPTVWRSCSD